MKAKKLLLEMLIIVSLVTAFGAWTLNEWYKRYPRIKSTGIYSWNNNYLLGEKERKRYLVKESAKIEKQVKIYKGKWHKTYLEVIGKCY